MALSREELERRMIHGDDARKGWGGSSHMPKVTPASMARSVLAVKGVFASRLASGRQTENCRECQSVLAFADSLAQARTMAVECSMYGSDWPDGCWRKGRERKQ
jgi:hypothetical protein